MNQIKNMYLSVLMILLALPIKAQTMLSGTVSDETGKALTNVVVKAFSMNHQMKKYVLSNRRGEFKLLVEESDSIDNLTFSRLGYKTKIFLRKDFGKLDEIVLHDEAIKIKEVVVRSTPIREKGDTLIYNVGAFKKSNDRTIEDVIKRFPGIHVDNTGSIYYQGEPINKFYIENMDMLSGSYKLATKNINADDIATVSVYENHQPVRALKDFSFSNKAALNLTLKNSRRLKPIGYFQQGVGYDEQTLCKSNLFAMQVGKKFQHLLSLKYNDIGNTYNTQGVYDADLVADFSSFTWNGIGLSAQDMPDISLNRYLNNKSGEASLNSLFKLKNKQTLTLNFRYAGDDIHYQNQKNSSIFVGDNQYLDISEKVQAAVYSNRLVGKMTIENNMDKVYFWDHLAVNANFYHKQFGLEDNFDGIQKQKSENSQFANQLAFIYRIGKKMFQFKSNVRFSNTPVNRLQAFTDNKKWLLFQSLQETAFQTDEHTAFGWQLGRWLQTGMQIDFESNYNKISLSQLHAEKNLNDSFSGYMLNTNMAAYLRLNWDKLVWELKVPLSLINVHFENAGSNNDFRLDKVYANVNTTISWKVAKGARLRLAGGSRSKFGSIANFVTSPIYYTYKDVTTQGAGNFSNGNTLFASGFFDYHNAIKGFFASVMASVSRLCMSSMSQTTISDGSVHKEILDKKNSLVERRLTFDCSKKIRSTDTSLSLVASLGSANTNIMAKDHVLKLVNDNYRLTTTIAQTLWNDKLNCSLNYAFFQMQNKVQAMKDKIQNNQAALEVSCFLVKELEVFGRMNMNWLKEETFRKRESYASMGMRYKVKSWEVECLAQNLTNERKYVINKQYGESNYCYIYYLRPISCFVSVMYSF